jgi:hypothetical protein
MSRVYGNVDEATVHLIDDLAGKAGLNRSEWISKAIESYLHLGDAATIEPKVADALGLTADSPI